MSFNVTFWNKNLEPFFKATESEKHIHFWSLLTQKQNADFEFIFENKHFPWDWSFITENCSEETILDSYEDDELFDKWDWKIATRKFRKETILENLDILTEFIDWQYVINELFNQEFVFEIPKLKITYRLSLLESDKQNEIWKILTAKYPFEKVFPIVEQTFQFDVWKWDWDYISQYEYLPTDFATLNKFKEYINWGIFSNCNSIKRKFEFNKSEWSYQEYFKYVLKYLRTKKLENCRHSFLGLI